MTDSGARPRRSCRRFFHANNRFGKGSFYWANRQGQPVFHYDLYLQPEPHIRNLITHAMAAK